MDPVQFPNYIQNVISMLEVGEITLNYAFERITFLVADVDNLVNLNDLDLSHILMNRHVNSLVRKLNEPLDVENMITYNANIQPIFPNHPNLQNSQNRQMINNVVAFILKEINPIWIIDQNSYSSTEIPLFLPNTDHVSSYIPASFLQQSISEDERERERERHRQYEYQHNYKRKRDHEH